MRTQQTELFPSVVTQLNEAGGVVDMDLEAINIDPQQRANLPQLAGAIGVALSEIPRTAARMDRPLNVYRDDFYRARIDPEDPKAGLARGLYMFVGDHRRPHAKQLAVIGNEACRLELPGVVGRHDGVVVSEQEHIWIVRNATDLAKAVDAKTRRANLDNQNCEEVEETAGRSVAHAMEAKRQSLLSLDVTLSDQRDVLWRVARDAKHVWRTAYLAKNLNRDRKLADELIHEAARIACINLGYGTTVVNALQRAVTSDLYRRGSSRELSQSWRTYAAFVGRYTNAKRGKTDQSLQACERQLARHEHYLKTA